MPTSPLSTTLVCRVFARTATLLTLSALSALVVVAAVPERAEAHAAGALDPHGCHTDNRKNRDYHCHRGRYNGIRFTSKADMLKKKKAGVTAEELRAGEAPDESAAQEEAQEEESRGWSLFGKEKEKEKAATGQAGKALVPKGIEARLRTLKSLHDEGLISDQEYEQKKLEILGDL